MTQIVSLRTLVDKTPTLSLLREMIGFAAERLTEMEVAAALRVHRCLRRNEPASPASQSTRCTASDAAAPRVGCDL